MIAVTWVAAAHADPMPGLTRSRTALRRLDCERMGVREAAERYPGRVEVPDSRAADPDRTYVVCTERLLRPGTRPERDDAVLSELEATADAIAAQAASSAPALAGRSWHVESWYPSPEVSYKLGFAVKNALGAHGLAVSDRVPLLGAPDLAVITRLPLMDAWPAACARFEQSGGLDEGDVLLGVVHLDPRETVLHAGLCVDGGWTWLR